MAGGGDLVSGVRSILVEQLPRYDDDALAALANRGLLRRAQKDEERQPAVIAEESAVRFAMQVGTHCIEFDRRGIAQATCTCPSTGVCQHILHAVLTLRRLTVNTEPGSANPASVDPLESLRAELLAIPTAALIQHAGRTGYRWAWQFLQDLSPAHALSVSGDVNVVLGFKRPRIAFRYVGGGLDGLVADGDLPQVKKYRVAAVLAFHAAAGMAIAAPEAARKPATQALKIGKDHELGTATAVGLEESRARLCKGVLQVFEECVESGLSHVSRGTHERMVTLAVWAQGAECPRLAISLRRIADHVDLLIERAGGADEHRLLDKVTEAYGLVVALLGAAERGAVPDRLVGRSRSKYEESGGAELFGLGARPWRSASGYVGLTMLFWSPSEREFLTCTDARPESMRGFNPLERYKMAGPWSGLGAPVMATGRRIALSDLRLSSAGRISASENTVATVLPLREDEDLTSKLRSLSTWSAIRETRTAELRSLLSEPQPAKDWVTLRPARVGKARFDPARQVLLWRLYDATDEPLDCELSFDDFTSHAIARLEQLNPAQFQSGTLVIARLRPLSRTLVAEPLSLVYPAATAREVQVDCLYFDVAPDPGRLSRFVERLRSFVGAEDVAPVTNFEDNRMPDALLDLRRDIRLHAERGLAEERATQFREAARLWIERAATLGLTALGSLAPPAKSPGAELLLLNYACLQYERILCGVTGDGDA